MKIYKLKDWISNSYDDFSSGHQLYSKLAFIVSIATLIGVYEIKLSVFIIVTIILFVLIYIGGAIYNKYFRDRVISRQLRNTEIDKLLKQILKEIQKINK